MIKYKVPLSLSERQQVLEPCSLVCTFFTFSFFRQPNERSVYEQCSLSSMHRTNCTQKKKGILFIAKL